MKVLIEAEHLPGGERVFACSAGPASLSHAARIELVRGYQSRGGASVPVVGDHRTDSRATRRRTGDLSHPSAL